MTPRKVGFRVLNAYLRAHGLDVESEMDSLKLACSEHPELG